MKIIWKYLDKRAATIAALKDYDSMAFIIRDTEAQVAKAETRLGSVGGMRLSSIPSVHNPKAAEERMAAVVDEVSVIEERFRQAQEYMSWFQPAWDQLEDEERYILRTFYVENSYGAGAVYEIADHLHIEQTAAYKRKNRALCRLQVLLFGRD